MICRCLVLIPSLLIVASLTERLPVVSVPEELRITSVRNDVVNDRCPRVLWRILLKTPDAQRMRAKELLRLPCPSAVVATLAGRSRLIYVQWLVLVAVLLTRFDQGTAAWVFAGYQCFVRQHSSPPITKALRRFPSTRLHLTLLLTIPYHKSHRTFADISGVC
jgi:hypothetical protein